MKKHSRIFLEEVEERPYHKFNIAFSLMSLLPLLAIFYILINNLYSFEMLGKNTWVIIVISLFIVLCGYVVGYKIISGMLQRVIYYATRAKRSDQLKSKLIASVSHEFKNPLAALRLCLFDMTDDLTARMNPAQKEMLERCNNIISRLSRLVSNLLDVYKIEAAMIEMNKTLCDLLKIVEVQIKENENSFRKKNIAVRLVKESGGKEIPVWADEEKIAIVINNLLGNAVKYTPQEGSIIVRIIDMDAFVRMEFQDTGEGIPDDKITKVFDKFEKIDSSQEGTGLGLAIAKDIIELHKGTIEVQSRRGAGSKFIIILPKSLRVRRKKRLFHLSCFL